MLQMASTWLSFKQYRNKGSFVSPASTHEGMHACMLSATPHYPHAVVAAQHEEGGSDSRPFVDPVQ